MTNQHQPHSIGRAFVDAVAARDERSMAEAVSDDVQMRALLPRGNRAFSGTDEVVATFRDWYGDATSVELLDSAVEVLGGSTHLSWRLRVLSPSRPGPHLVEQQVFAAIDEQIERIDLLCSGFQPEVEAEQP